MLETVVLFLVLLAITNGFVVDRNVESLRKLLGSDKFSASSATLDVLLNNNYSEYSVTINGQSWLKSGLTSFRNKNNGWADVRINGTKSHSGNDNFGDYNEMTIFWQDINDENAIFATGFRMYPNMPDSIVFTQTFVNGRNIFSSLLRLMFFFHVVCCFC